MFQCCCHKTTIAPQVSMFFYDYIKDLQPPHLYEASGYIAARSVLYAKPTGFIRLDYTKSMSECFDYSSLADSEGKRRAYIALFQAISARQQDVSSRGKPSPNRNIHLFEQESPEAPSTIDHSEENHIEQLEIVRQSLQKEFLELHLGQDFETESFWPITLWPDAPDLHSMPYHPLSFAIACKEEQIALFLLEKIIEYNMEYILLFINDQNEEFLEEFAERHQLPVLAREIRTAITNANYNCVRYHNRNPLQRTIDKGWKARISVYDDEHENLPKAWNVLVPILLHHKIHTVKVIAQDGRSKLRNDLTQCGKTIVIYAYKEQRPPKEWQNFFQEASNVLVAKHIIPGPLPKGDTAINGSNYFSYRCEGTKKTPCPFANILINTLSQPARRNYSSHITTEIEEESEGESEEETKDENDVYMYYN